MRSDPPVSSIRAYPARVTAAVLALIALSPPVAVAAPPSPDLQAGRKAYEQHCARCHGAEGHGDGVDAKRFYPRPRDLSLGVYKFRTTASGTPPADEDLYQTITNGLPGTNMPDWQHLSEADRWQLVYYLKSLSPLFTEHTPEPIQAAADPGAKQADLAKGQGLFAKLGCIACHGATGRANGSSAAGLVDDWGKPIRPANLTQGWGYRGGADARAVMSRLLAGIDGAGMPSYAGAVSLEDAWHLAYYVVSLQEPVAWNRIARAARVDSPPPTTLDDARWRQAERTDLQFRNAVNADGEWVAPATITHAAVQVLYTADLQVAVRVTWDDPTQDTKSPPDAFAVLKKPEGWPGDSVTLQAWPYVGAPPLEMCLWAAEPGTFFQMTASDFSSVTAARPGRAMVVPGDTRYEDGRWSGVFGVTYPKTAAVVKARREAGQTPTRRLVSLAFAAWDGANPEARAVSPWLDVEVHEDVPRTRPHQQEEE